VEREVCWHSTQRSSALRSAGHSVFRRPWTAADSFTNVQNMFCCAPAFGQPKLQLIGLLLLMLRWVAPR